MSPHKYEGAPQAAQPEDFLEQQPAQEPGADGTGEAWLPSDEQLLDLSRERICPQCPELARVLDEKLRVVADTDNLRKRLQREKEEFAKFAAESVLADLLPVLDNLDLALEHGRKLEGCSDLLQGVDMTRKLFLDVLERHGLEPMGAAGEEFDPAWHDALGQQPHPDIKPGSICQMLQKGYRLKGRLLRPAKVLISQECKNLD